MALQPKLLSSDQFVASAGMTQQGSHAPAAIELMQRRHDRFAFGTRFGKAHRIRKLLIWNINCRFHASIFE